MNESLHQYIRNAECYALYRKHLLSFIRPEAYGMFNVHEAKGKKLLTKLRVSFKAQKLQHNFEEEIIPLCICG